MFADVLAALRALASDRAAVRAEITTTEQLVDAACDARYAASGRGDTELAAKLETVFDRALALQVAEESPWLAPAIAALTPVADEQPGESEEFTPGVTRPRAHYEPTPAPMVTWDDEDPLPRHDDGPDDEVLFARVGDDLAALIADDGAWAAPPVPADDATFWNPERATLRPQAYAVAGGAL